MAKVLESIPETWKSALVAQSIECLRWTTQSDQRGPARICRRTVMSLLDLHLQLALVHGCLGLRSVGGRGPTGLAAVPAA